MEWHYKAYSLWDGKKYTDPNKAIDYLNNAINLQPDYALAYVHRGAAYGELGKHQRAIEDYNKAIRLKPDFAGAYVNRGIAYLFTNNFIRGCSDAQRACELGNCGLYDIAKDKGYCR